MLCCEPEILGGCGHLPACLYTALPYALLDPFPATPSPPKQAWGTRPRRFGPFRVARGAVLLDSHLDHRGRMLRGGKMAGGGGGTEEGQLNEANLCAGMAVDMICHWRSCATATVHCERCATRVMEGGGSNLEAFTAIHLLCCVCCV